MYVCYHGSSMCVCVTVVISCVCYRGNRVCVYVTMVTICVGVTRVTGCFIPW